MAKVMIYEDEKSDLVSRYGDLTKDHEIFVWLNPLRWDDSDMGYLVAEGFRSSNVQIDSGTLGIPDSERTEWFRSPPAADIYFVDGLCGLGIDVLEKLPRERAYLNSTDGSMRMRAEMKGFQILETTPKEAIAKVLS